MKHSLLLFASALLLASCGGGTTPAASSSVAPAASSSEAPAVSSTVPAEKVTYQFNVNAYGEGGKKGVSVSLLDEAGQSVASGKTARGGGVSIEAPKGVYSVVVGDLPAGYYQHGEVTTTLEETSYSLELYTKLAEGKPEKGTVFYKGDVLYDHSFTMVDGTTTSLAEQLAKYDVCLVNFWGIQCGVCRQELPELNAYYEEMKDQVGLICDNSYSGDTNAEIKAFMSENNYSVPSTEYDDVYFDEMGVSGWPTTVVIDRYGRYAGGMAGFITGQENFFHNMVDKFLGPNYVPSY